MAVKGQLGMDEEIIEDDELEEALEAREAAKALLAGPKEIYAGADKLAKALIERADLPDVARIGRFRITRSEVEARHVEFDTEPSERIAIAADADVVLGS